MKRLTNLCLLMLAAFAAAIQSHAIPTVIGVEPAAGSTVSEISQVTLNFSEPVDWGWGGNIVFVKADDETETPVAYFYRFPENEDSWNTSYTYKLVPNSWSNSQMTLDTPGDYRLVISGEYFRNKADENVPETVFEYTIEGGEQPPVSEGITVNIDNAADIVYLRWARNSGGSIAVENLHDGINELPIPEGLLIPVLELKLADNGREHSVTLDGKSQSEYFMTPNYYEIEVRKGSVLDIVCHGAEIVAPPSRTAFLTLDVDDASRIMVTIGSKEYTQLQNGANELEYDVDEADAVCIEAREGYLLSSVKADGQEQGLSYGDSRCYVYFDYFDSLSRISVVTKRAATQKKMTFNANVTGVTNIRSAFWIRSYKEIEFVEGDQVIEYTSEDGEDIFLTFEYPAVAEVFINHRKIEPESDGSYSLTIAEGDDLTIEDRSVGVNAVVSDKVFIVTDLLGRWIRSVSKSDDMKALAPGLYIVNGVKTVIR